MRFIMGTAKYKRKGLQMEEAYPTRRNCGALVEHRRLLTEDPSYVAARSEIENSARAYERGFRVPARVGITAGASAPEVLVREVVEALGERFDVVEDVADHEPERMTFKLPRELVA